MSTGVGILTSIAVGAVLALLVVFGGVSAVTPGANPTSASDSLVSYDGS